MSRVLVIDDDSGVRESVSRMLSQAGYTVRQAGSGEEGFQLARDGSFDVILSDMRMPGVSGIDVLRRLRDQRVDASFIIMTGYGTVDTAVEAMKLGAIDFVQKPFHRNELLMRVRAAAERRQLVRQVSLLERQIRMTGALEALVGESAAMQKVRETIARSAAAPGAVLITGETGTGKELAARALHANSPRASRPFVTVNCATLAESLLETELFGHARGAFTGAGSNRPGLIVHAAGGTLFLDEIGTMSKPLQARLLRAVEAGEVRRVGENESRNVDVRFVSATNIDLAEAMKRGEFRDDLYYRINVHRVHMPPLRERAEDVPLLVEHFLRKYGPASSVTACSPAALDLLLAYQFPGNVRELEHIIQRAVAVARSDRIEPADLPEEITAGGAPSGSAKSVAAARERAERDRVMSTLARHRGEIAAAARELQVSRTTMWRLMKKHGIPT